MEKILPVGACLDVLEEGYRDLGNEMAATGARLRRGQTLFIARNISQYECLAPNGFTVAPNGFAETLSTTDR
jgi:hypothetical protein